MADNASQIFAAPAVAVRGPLLGNLFCVLSMALWAMGFPAIDTLVGRVPPLPMTALRMGLAVAFLLPIWALVEGKRGVMSACWWQGLWVGGLGFGLGGTLLFAAQSHIDPVTLVILTACSPIFGILLECLVDGRRLTVWLILGLMLSVLGGVLAYLAQLDLFAMGAAVAARGAGFFIGAALVLASVMFFTWGSRATVRALPGMTGLGRTTVTLVGALIVTLGLSLAAGQLGTLAVALPQFSPADIGALLIYSLGALAVSQLLWILGVGHLGIGVASMHFNSVAFYVMVIMFVLGADWNWVQAAGALLVGLGVLLAQRRRRGGSAAVSV